MLLRFFKAMDYAEQFQRGSIYMNSLSWFMANGFEAQKDMMEGVIFTRRADKMPVEQVLQQGMIFDARYQAKGYLYCNVCCLSAVNIHIIDALGKTTITAPRNMEAFGEYAVIVQDTDAFAQRVIARCNQLNYKVLCGPVNYHAPQINGQIQEKPANMIFKSMEYIDIKSICTNASAAYDSFDKKNNYEGQNEWRICLYRGERSMEHYTLQVGDLSDITCVVDAREVCTEEGLKHQILRLGPSRDDEQTYYGNISRRGLKQRFYALGDYQASLIIGI